jgi:magnesium transporter
MIRVYLAEQLSRAISVDVQNAHLLQEAIWIDLLFPTLAEEQLMESVLEMDIPTREEMREIELSSRLYKASGNLYMTGNMLAESASLDPKQDAVTFVITAEQLITIRYVDPQAFKLFALNLPKLSENFLHHPVDLLIELLDATTDRLADILEVISHQLDTISKTIFRQDPAIKKKVRLNYQHLIQLIGENADLNTKARESLVTFNRLMRFLTQAGSTRLGDSGESRLNILMKDIHSLTDHSTFLSSKINFLLDTVLGLINIEQNAIIKIFSVAAVIFLPPTLIASIYGMNFRHIPELSFKYGYLFAIGLMMLSSWLPYKYFKRRQWL